MKVDEVKGGLQPGWSVANIPDHPAEQKQTTVEEAPFNVADDVDTEFETSLPETTDSSSSESQASSKETTASEPSSIETTESETLSPETADDNNNDADYTLKPKQQDHTEMKKTNLLTAFVSLLFGSTNGADKHNISSVSEVEQLNQGDWKIEGNIYANLSIKPVIDKPPPTTEKITTENNKTACKCDNGNVGRIRTRDDDYWSSSKQKALEDQPIHVWFSQELNFNGINCRMDKFSALQYLRTEIATKRGKRYIVKYRIKGAINKQTLRVVKNTLARIKKFSCLKFERQEKSKGRSDRIYFSPSQEYAELFLKIMQFILKKYDEKFEKLQKETKVFFKKRISEEKWENFLQEHATEYLPKWMEFNHSHRFWRQNRIKTLQENWQKHMNKVSPFKMLVIHIKGDCSGKVRTTEGSYTYFNGQITMSARVKNNLRENPEAGKLSKNQEKWLAETVWDRTLTHEMFHAFGIPHTQTRRDRDEYINMSKEIAKSPKFEICTNKELCKTYKNINYECDSIMHIGKKPIYTSIDPKDLLPWEPKEESCFLQRTQEFTALDWPTINDWKHFKAAVGCKKKKNKKGKNKKKTDKKRSKTNGKRKKSNRRIIGNMQESALRPNTDNNCMCDSKEFSQEYGGADYAASGENGADYALSGENGADYAGEIHDFHDDNDDKCYIVE